MSQTVKVVYDGGTGKATVFVVELNPNQSSTHVAQLQSQPYLSEIKELAQQLSRQGERALVVELSVPNANNWRTLCERFVALLNEAKIRQAVFVGIRGGSILVQYLALSELKRIRAMMLIDATARAKESRWMQVIAKIEGFLPLGLPFRQRGEEFDSKPELHRVRCPALIVTSASATQYLIEQAELLAHGLPTAWRSELKSSAAESNLAELLTSLQTVPNKAPQKRLAA